MSLTGERRPQKRSGLSFLSYKTNNRRAHHVPCGLTFTSLGSLLVPVIDGVTFEVATELNLNLALIECRYLMRNVRL